MIRVLVWAKSAIARAGLESIVEADSRFQVAGPGSRSADLLSALRECAPDVVLLDLAGTSLARALPGYSDQPAPPAIVVLLENMQRADLLRLLQAGVRAVLVGDSHPAEITTALEAAHAGLAVFSPEILDVLLPTSGELAAEGELPPGQPLTERESGVLALMAEGAGNREIAARLHISEHTVKFHVSSILGKLGAATRTEAVARGYREGLIVM